MTKVWEDDEDFDEIRPTSVTVTLSGSIEVPVSETETTTQAITLPSEIKDQVTLDESNNWTYKWEGLDMYQTGTVIDYIVSEATVEAPAGYEAGYTPDVEIAPLEEVDGVLTYAVTVTNRHTPERIDFEFTKIGESEGSEEGINLAGITFTLYTDEECTEEYTKPEAPDTVVTATSDETGRVFFEKLPFGTYYMKETDLGDNDDLYWDNDTIYMVEALPKDGDTEAHVVLTAISGTGAAADGTEEGDIRTGRLSETENGYVINNDLVRYEFNFVKLDSVDEIELEGASFDLYKAEDMVENEETGKLEPKEDAEKVTSTTTDEDGIGDLGSLLAGEYYLVETKAPSGYKLLEEPIALVVGKDEVTFNEEDVTPEDGITTISLTVYNDPKFGDLLITKYIDKYDRSEDATFVFDVEARIDGDVVFSTVAILTFLKDAEDPQLQLSATVENIPAGAEVTVTERYYGSHYKLASEGTCTVTIVANRTVSVEFTNEYTPEEKGGHGAANIFDPDDSDNGWTWTRAYSTNLKEPPLPDAEEVE